MDNESDACRRKGTSGSCRRNPISAEICPKTQQPDGEHTQTVSRNKLVRIWPVMFERTDWVISVIEVLVVVTNPGVG